jgi:predicted ATPase/class 3 adenylate cyclase
LGVEAAGRQALPSGNVTFLVTDIEGSTRLFRRNPSAYSEALDLHSRLLRESSGRKAGHEVKSLGDGLLFAFAGAADAVAASIGSQTLLGEADWPEDVVLRVRMGLHTAVAEPTPDGDYVSLALHLASRICGAGHGGQVLMSSDTARLVAPVLPAEASVVDRGLFMLVGFDEAERIFQLVHPKLGASFGALNASPAVSNNLPDVRTSFVGRKRDVDVLTEVLERERLVTVVGPGGAGKTRLAVEVGARVVSRFDAGVRLVDLSPLRDPGMVSTSVASSLGLQLQPGDDPIEMMALSLAGRSFLLLIDNCEHVLDAVADTVDSLAARLPSMTVLATSREPLAVADEFVWRIDPLGLPTNRSDLEQIVSCDAVQLFQDRARMAFPSFSITPANADAAVTICEHLGGLPLGIELVAAQVRSKPVTAIADRLSDSGAALAVGRRRDTGRHRSVEATIDWSYQLLDRDERSLLKAISVFASAFTADAVAAVSDLADPLETLSRLVDKSLVLWDPATNRYRLLTSIRHYGVLRLGEEDGADAQRPLQQAHADFFANLAQEASIALTGWHQSRWLSALELEHANIAAAVEFLLQDPLQVSAGLQIVVDLGRFWHVRGHLAECSALLERALTSLGSNLETELHTAAMILTGLSGLQADLSMARSNFERALAAARSSGNQRLAASAMWGLALYSFYVGDVERSRNQGRESVEIARDTGDLVLLGECLLAYGVALVPLMAAEPVHREGLEVTRRSGDRFTASWLHNNLGDKYLTQGELGAARSQFEQALTICREIGAPAGAPLINLCWVHLLLQSVESAHAAALESLRESELTHSRVQSSYSILGLACAAAADQRWERAGGLLGFADSEMMACGGTWVDPELTYRDQLRAQVEEHLADGFDQHYEFGRSRTRAEMIELALSQTPRLR